MRTAIRTCVLATAGGLGFAQATAEFDVASIKQVAESRPGGLPDTSFVGNKLIKITGNRVTVTANLRAIIAGAYDLKDYQIAGGPSWADSTIFTIEAKTSGSSAPAEDQVRLMLQSLLADRFQLKSHLDKKEMPVYHLTLTKKSSLRQAAPDEAFNWKVAPQPDGTMRSKATREPMADFVQLIGVSADRPVLNKTGLSGDIDYEIQFQLPGGTAGNGDEAGHKTPFSVDDLNRAIVDAAKDQLGLKLEPVKDSVEVLVLDGVSKPSDN